MFPYLPGSEIGNIGVTHIGGAAPAVSWWLADGDSAANVAGVWQPKNAASLAASYLRLGGTLGNANIDPAVVGGDAPAWDAVNGWHNNGTTNYLKTGIIPPMNQSWSAIVRVSSAAAGSFVFPFGAITGAGLAFSIAFDTVSNAVYYYNGGFFGKSRAFTAGVWAIGGEKGYYNGVDDGGTITGSSANTFEMYIGTANNAGVPYFAVSQESYLQAIAFYSVVKTPTQIAALYTAIAAL